MHYDYHVCIWFANSLFLKKPRFFSFSRQTVVRQEYNYNIFLWGPILFIFRFNTSKEVFRNLRFLFFASTMEFVRANDQYRTEVNIQGMALKHSVFKRWSVAAPHLCDVKCGQEITCQSYNYNRKYQICELNNRTKAARPENFLSAPAWFYIRRLNGRGKKSEVDFCFSRFSPHLVNLVLSHL